MFCPNCRSNFNEEIEYCTNCGVRLEVRKNNNCETFNSDFEIFTKSSKNPSTYLDKKDYILEISKTVKDLRWDNKFIRIHLRMIILLMGLIAVLLLLTGYI